MNMRIRYIFFAIFFLASCVNNKEEVISTDLVQSPLTANKYADEVPMPKIDIRDDLFDFGEMNQDESVTTHFGLKNIGDAPLLIRSVKGSCGCTIAEWPREPVAVGGDAIISVTFNSEQKEGKQNKTVTLVTNAIPSTKVLTITGTVLVP